MSVNIRKNYYEILGVSPESSFSEIKTAFRRLARKYHPDVNKEPQSVQKFKDITEAYEILSDEAKRKEYNAFRGYCSFSENSKKSENFSSTSSCKSSKSCEKEFEQKNADDIKSQKKPEYASDRTFKQTNSKRAYEFKNDKPLKDVINDIFDGISKQKKEKLQPKNGEDINAETLISLEESIKGCERVVNVLHREICPNCGGRRFINGAKCSVCNGAGEFEQYKKITVKIPPQTKNGTRLRIIKEGNPGFNGGVAGNLYLTVKVRPDNNFEIIGNDIFYHVPLTPFEAVLGGKIEVPVFDGKVMLSVPPMTRTGQKFRLKGEGLKTNNKFGDMIITVEIQLPKSLSDDEVKLYEKLKKLSHGNIRDSIIHD